MVAAVARLPSFSGSSRRWPLLRFRAVLRRPDPTKQVEPRNPILSPHRASGRCTATRPSACARVSFDRPDARSDALRSTRPCHPSPRDLFPEETDCLRHGSKLKGLELPDRQQMPALMASRT